MNAIEQKPFSCLECGKTFSLHSNLRTHVLSHAKHGRHNDCGSLSSSSPREQHYWLPPTNSNEEKLNKVNEALTVNTVSLKISKESNDQVLVLDHLCDQDMQKRNCRKKLSCFQCRKEFSSEGLLQKHMKFHGGKTPLVHRKFHEGKTTTLDRKPPLCDGSLHPGFVHSTSNQDTLQCDECGRVFKTRPKLDAHINMHKDDGLFKCKVCQKQLSSAVNFRAHMNKHSDVYLHLCPVCKKKFLHKASLTAHMMLHLQKAPFTCESCGSKFYSQSKLQQHISTHGDDKRFSCTICGKDYTCSSTLKEHILLHSKTESISCRVCGKVFTLQKYLDQHRKVHMTGSQHLCKHCGKSFVQSGDLQLHVKEHTVDVKPFGCNVCNKRFHSKGILTIHERIHSNKRLYQCDICKRKFVQKSHLKTHMITHTGDKPYPCQDCGQRFAWKNLLHMHVKLKHSSESRLSYTCSECDKCFKQKNSYDYHTKIQVEGKLFTCKLCSKEFSRQTCLQEHMRGHMGDMHKCPVCNKVFKNPHSCKAHVLLHTDEKAHTCSICNKSFKLLCILKNHMLTHILEKGCKCSICGRCFRQKSHLQTHMTTHTGTKPYECKVCGRAFAQNGNLKVHLKTHAMNIVPHDEEVVKKEIMPCEDSTSEDCQKEEDHSYLKSNLDERETFVENLLSTPVMENDLYRYRDMHDFKFDNVFQTSTGIYDCVNYIPYKSFQEIVLKSHEKSITPEFIVSEKTLVFVDDDPIVSTDFDLDPCLTSDDNELLSGHRFECILHVTEENTESLLGAGALNSKETSHLRLETVKCELELSGEVPIPNESDMQPLNAVLCEESEKGKNDLKDFVKTGVQSISELKSGESSEALHGRSAGEEGDYINQIKDENWPFKPHWEAKLEGNLNIKLEICEGAGENILPQLQVSSDTEESIQAFVLPSEEPELGVVTVNPVGKERHHCNLCNKSYTEKSNLNNHMRVHTGVKPYVCNFCNKAFSLLSSYKTHLRFHTGEKPYECSSCQKRFSQISNYKAHLVVHGSERPYRCMVCGENFKLNFVLKRHMLTHRDSLNSQALQRVKSKHPNLFACKYCDKTFARERQLENHSLIHTVKQIFSCPSCDKVFNLESSLKTHMLCHLESKSMKCSVCQKDFKSQSSLNSHMLTHTKSRVFHCNECNKTFQRQSSYRLHLKRHAGEMRFSCNVCKKRFFQKVSMQQHMLIHTGEKPHQCKICNKSFRQRTHLRMHLVTHTGDKHFKCIVCSKTFSVKASLKQHMRIHTGELKHFCMKCKKGFTHLSSFRFHMKKHICDDSEVTSDEMCSLENRGVPVSSISIETTHDSNSSFCGGADEQS